MSISFELPQSRIISPLRYREGTTSVWTHPAAQCSMLLVWGLFLFLYGIHQGDLYRTEGLRAIIGKEMYRTGDWTVPKLYGEPILTKPPLFYWAIASTGYLFGEVTTWSARLPAALAGLGCLLIVYFTLRRYSQSSWLPLLAALALPCSGMWLEKASSSEIDTLLVMFVLGAWACFLRVLEGLQAGESHLGWWIATLLCVAGGVLTKWTGFLFFYVMAVPLLLWQRQLWRLFHWHHLLAALIGMAIVWCWLGLVVFDLGWANVSNMLWKEGAPRVLHSKNASQQLLMETLLHPFKIIGIAAPWSIIVVLGWRKRVFSSLTLIEKSLLCWAVAGTLMMTVFPDHNIRQSFSLVPAWTLLGVFTLKRMWQADAVPVWFKQHPFRWLMIAMLAWSAIKIIHVEVLIPARFRERPSLEAQATIMQQFVPTGATLYLARVKDECLLFNYGCGVQRLRTWSQLPADGMIYCAMTEEERRDFTVTSTSRIVLEKTLQDAQGDVLVLVQLQLNR